MIARNDAVMWARIRAQLISLPAAHKPSAVYDRPYPRAKRGHTEIRPPGLANQAS
jgi:hypothetical protein